WRPTDDWDAWRAPSDLPDPRWLVRRNWRRRERRKGLGYLRSGHAYAGYAGYSYCRFRLCWTRPRRVGFFGLTVGEVVWPAGLAHYVERHSVCLPDEFIAGMQSRGWRPCPGGAVAAPGAGEPLYDVSFWVAWASREQKRPWYQIW